MQYVADGIAIVCSDRTTTIVAATNVASYVMPFTMDVTDVQAQLEASGGLLTVDINLAGTSVLLTKLTIDSAETSSLTAATPYKFVAPSASTAEGKMVTFPKGTKLSIDIDGASGTPLGLIVTLLGYRDI